MIETAIAVLIISLLVFPMLKLMEVGRESRLKQEGIERNTAVIASLKRYWMDNGRLPRPASTYSVPGDSTYGQEVSMDDVQKWWEWDRLSNIGAKILPGVTSGPGSSSTSMKAVDASGVGQNTLRDTSLSPAWEPDQFKGSYVRLYCKGPAGENYGSRRLIISNTADTLTLSPLSGTMASAPSSTDFRAWGKGSGPMESFGPMASFNNVTSATVIGAACSSALSYHINHGVLIGSVPFAELGLSENQSLDPYGRRLTYMVSAHLTGQKTSGGDVVPTLYAGRVDIGAIKLINQLFARGNTWEEAYNNGYDYPTSPATSDQTFFCRQENYFGITDSNNPLHATNQNCCTNDRCFPHAREQFTGVSSGSSIPFAIINHGRDGRGAFPRMPVLNTADSTGVSGSISSWGGAGSSTVRAIPFAKCEGNYNWGSSIELTLSKYYAISVATTNADLSAGLAFDNCAHTIYSDREGTDINYHKATRPWDLFFFSTIRVIQKEVKESGTPVLGGIIQRFTYKPGPFYYDDIVSFATGIDMGGWSERSSPNMLKQTSTETASGWTMIASRAGKSQAARFPLQIGLTPDDSNFTNGYASDPNISNGNVRARSLYTDMLCSYGPINLIMNNVRNMESIAAANARMACVPLARFLSGSVYAMGGTTENAEKRRTSLTCLSASNPIYGVYGYPPTNDNNNSSTRYFNLSGSTSSMRDSYILGGIREPVLGLSESDSCQPARLDAGMLEYDGSGCGAGAKKIAVDSSTGAVTLGCH